MNKCKSITKFVFSNIFEPIIFGFILLILFAHIQYVLNHTGNFTFSGIWEALLVDLTTYPVVWIILLIAFVIWFVLKIIIHKWDKEERDEIINANTKALNRINETLDRFFKRFPEDGE